MKKFDAKRTTEFMRLLHAFQGIERAMYAPDLNRKENDIEHSYLLAMLCWYLVDARELALSKERVLRYALVHDFVEVYAGDTYFLDHEAIKTKHVREEKSRVRIQTEFPEFTDLHTSIETYEKQIDPEAVFVKAVDKIIPVIINYIQEGYTWKQMKVGKDDLYAHKRKKLEGQNSLADLLEQFFAEMEKDWKKYFNF
jgi:putative hydrolases of HD superfamily